MYSSASKTVAALAQAYQIGAASFLFSPISPEQLYAVVDGAVVGE
jgi:DNA-binding NtrC family response regulator